MKLNKKIIFPAFALLAGVSLVGSISGTVAWYQYSTRANASYIGSSAGVSGNLQIRLPNGEWGPRVETNDVLNYIGGLNPIKLVTSGNLAKNDSLKTASWNLVASAATGTELPAGEEGNYFFRTDENKLYLKGASEWALVEGITLADAAPTLNGVAVGGKYFNTTENKLYEKVLTAKDFYLNPNYGYGPYNQWFKASASDYVKIPLELRFIGNDENDFVNHEVYLSKLLIQKDTVRDNDANNHGDLSDAVRVHFSVYQDGDEANANNFLVSKNGGTTVTHGKLKLGRGIDYDKEYIGDDWNFDGQGEQYIDYGAGQQVSYAASNSASAIASKYYEDSDTGWDKIAVATAGTELPDTAQQGDYFFKTDAVKLYVRGASEWAEYANEFTIGNADPNLNTESNKDYYFNNVNNSLFERVAAVDEQISPILVSEAASDPITLENTDGRALGSTSNVNQKILHVDVTIWLEGWQKFADNGVMSAMWKKNLIGAYFDVGMQFAVQKF